MSRFVLYSAMIIAYSAAPLQQASDVRPVDPKSHVPFHYGLWESEMTTGLRSGDLMLFPSTSKSQSCFKDDKDVFFHVAGKCIPYVKRTAEKTEVVTFECNAGYTSISGSMTYEYTSPEQYDVSGTITTGMTGDSNPSKFSSHGRGHFLKEECGNLKPGESVDIQ